MESLSAGVAYILGLGAPVMMSLIITVLGLALRASAEEG
jgi:galactitol-specific phosphotransferase system IIC component